MRIPARLAATVVIGIWMVGAAAALAQSRAEPDLPMLVDLPNAVVPLRYTPGVLDRAARVQFRFQDLSDEFSLVVKGRFYLQIFVLAREEWKAAGFQRPYGLPELTASGALALPASSDPELVELWRGLLGGVLPTGMFGGILASTQDVGPAAMADLLGFVEAGHVLVEGRPGQAPPWLQELVAHVAARLALGRTEGGDLSRVDLAFARLVGAGGGDGAMALQSWRPDLPLAKWLWFQGQFARGAALYVAAKGPSAARWMVRDAVVKGKWPDEAKLLAKVAGLGEWKSAAFAR